MTKKEIEEIIKNLGGISFEDKMILVTGGAGFLGSWICDLLIQQKAKVKCLDNLASGAKVNIAHLIDDENFEFIEHDISQPIFFDEPIDVVLHLASRASPFEFEEYPIQILKANTLGIWVSLGIAKKHGARFLYTSTSEIYGSTTVIPTPESHNGNVNPIGPRSCYDEAKRCGESYVIAYNLQHDLDTRMVRIFNTYGPRMRAEGIYGRVIPRFIDQCLNNEPITVFGDGSQTRSFCYVADEVEGIIRLLSFDGLKGEVVNIGNDNEMTILELAEMIKNLTNSDSEIVFSDLPKDDPPRRCPDIGKANDLLGWRPKISIEEGLSRMIKSFEVGR
ncbi:MAG: UDP-glucuronic acid decarboxylase family protein [Halobacteriota archaeon]|nr:UDP-glucuronic acid decarboxylase family protein [Halobacteriota archaeon]